MWATFAFETAQNPKTARLAEALGISVYSACGLLALLWSWSIDHAQWETGDISDFRPSAVERACQWDGQRGQLFQALCVCGFLDGDPDSDDTPLYVHGWAEYNYPIIKKRREDAARKRDRRNNGSHPADVSSGQVQRTEKADESGRLQNTDTETETCDSIQPSTDSKKDRLNNHKAGGNAPARIGGDGHWRNSQTARRATAQQIVDALEAEGIDGTQLRNRLFDQVNGALELGMPPEEILRCREGPNGRYFTVNLSHAAEKYGGIDL